MMIVRHTSMDHMNTRHHASHTPGNIVRSGRASGNVNALCTTTRSSSLGYERAKQRSRFCTDTTMRAEAATARG